MRPQHLGVLVALASACAVLSTSFADGREDGRRAKPEAGPKAWCGPEVTELSDHVCFFDGGVPADGRRTLVVYLHGALAMTTPGDSSMATREEVERLARGASARIVR